MHFQFCHPIEHIISLIDRTLHVGPRRIPIRASNQSGKQCRFRESQIGGRLSEVGLAGGFQAVDA